MSPLPLLEMLLGLVILFEAVNKLRRADPFAGRVGLDRLRALAYLLAPWHWHRVALATALKVAAWFCLACGGGGSLAYPLFGAALPFDHRLAISVGFALLIVRTRVKEG